MGFLAGDTIIAITTLQTGTIVSADKTVNHITNLNDIRYGINWHNRPSGMVDYYWESETWDEWVLDMSTRNSNFIASDNGDIAVEFDPNRSFGKFDPSYGDPILPTRRHQTDKCSQGHKWVTYQGFRESFEFCSVCDKKR
jgi:hypothetical protein